MSYQQLLEFVTSRGFQMPAHVRDEHVPRVLPFVWVFGREHWAVSLYGANVFVDQVMVALELPPLSERVTGKFILDTQHDADSNPRLLLDVECAPLQSPDDTALAQDIQQSVTHQILRVNSEFAHYVPENSQAPVVVLQAYGAPALFPLGVKHKWTR